MKDPTIKRHKEIIRGYKAVKVEGKRYYTDGMGSGQKTYIKSGDILEVSGKPELCDNGIHFFRHLCFALYYLEQGNAIFEVETLGEETIEDTFKLVTCKIKILRKISEKEIGKKMDKKNHSGNRNSGNRNSGDWNSGDQNSGHQNSGHQNSGHRNSGNWNSGHRNSGNWNSGDQNSGDWNSGDWNSGDQNSGDQNSGDQNSGHRNSGHQNSGHRNSGDWNSGDQNSGDWNSGDRNSGDRNSGDQNSGNRNSGHQNSGDWNSGHRNSGNWNSGNFNSCNGYRNYFCTETKYFLFDIECKKETIDKIKSIDLWSWFSLEEKCIEGYKKAWSKCPKEKLDQLRAIPEFKTKKAKAKFKEITGLDL